MYQPHVLALEANQPLEVVNEDSTSHNVDALATNNREWNKAEARGTQVDDAFPQEEIAVLMNCKVYPWRRGLQTPVLCGDARGRHVRSEQPAVRDLHHCGLARKTGHGNPKSGCRCERKEGYRFRIQIKAESLNPPESNTDSLTWRTRLGWTWTRGIRRSSWSWRGGPEEVPWLPPSRAGSGLCAAPRFGSARRAAKAIRLCGCRSD
jgi:hypothetical protein